LDGRSAAPQPAAVAIVIHGPREIESMRRAGAAAARTLALVGRRLRPGITTADIDAWVREDTRRRGGRPSQLGYKGFPAAVCTSRNHVVCHGIPSPDERLVDGDIVNVDVTTDLDGFHGDTSITFCIGTPSRDAALVVELAQRGLHAGIAAVRPGSRLGDVGAAIEEVVHAAGCGLVHQFGGHGIGRKMHMPPHVGHSGPRGTGMRLRPGMTFTIEPMVTIGRPEIRILDDGWTVVTVDGSPSAQFEHTVLVTDDGHEILTRWVE
jgi:methionyl aminopeptidase